MVWFNFNYENENHFLINRIKILIKAILQVFLKKGKKLKYKNILKKLFFNIIKNFDIQIFFNNFFNEFLYFPFVFRLRAVAGRKLNIPLLLNKKKELMYKLRYFAYALKLRTEKKFEEKLLSELIDISQEKGFTKKRILQLYDDVKKNIVNLRFIRVRTRLIRK